MSFVSRIEASIPETKDIFNLENLSEQASVNLRSKMLLHKLTCIMSYEFPCIGFIKGHGKHSSTNIL